MSKKLGIACVMNDTTTVMIHVYCKYKLTLTGVATAIFHGTMAMRTEKNN